MESKQSRVTIFVVAMALLVTLFFAFRSGDDDSDSTTTTVATQPTDATTTGGAGAEESERPKPKPKPEIPEIVVSGGEPKGGVTELDYEKGDRVRFLVRSDVAEEIHVHGYDVTADIPAGGKAEVSFAADLEGVFEVELHGSGALIAELTVEP